MDFSDLSDDPVNDKIWVALRNPRLIPPNELRPNKDIPIDPVSGRPSDMQAAEIEMFAVFAKLIIGWRVYDASNLDIDPETGELIDQQLLPNPATPESVAKLPSAILTRITEEFTAATNPR